ncbi:GSTP1 [Symbiodinium pilosum]|uniref:GSTP1 protein n=1 Tax=Symbiodinium pilosum TaxID=2952 RepID=A0A812V8M7_SYMPI|nr:GSTP1 [Symbiodinium pilosum]
MEKAAAAFAMETPKELEKGLTLEYLALPSPISGRGGVVRFFLLANKVVFTEKLHSLADWGGSVKAKYVAEGISPAGHLPLLWVGDGPACSEHISLMRLVANLTQLKTAKDADCWSLYAQDMVADAYAEWRGDWASATFGGDDAAKDTYKATIPGRLKQFEGVIAKAGLKGAFISGDLPLWGDSALFSLISDNIATGYTGVDAVKEFPLLHQICTAYAGIEAVAGWYGDSSPWK